MKYTVTFSFFNRFFYSTIGHRESERALQLGHLYSGEEALKVGLIDELVSMDQMEEQVGKFCIKSTFAKFPSL